MTPNTPTRPASQHSSTCIATMCSMSTTATRRLPKGTRVDPIRVGLLLETRSKEQLVALSARAGVSMAVFIETALDHIVNELDDDGVPLWWPDLGWKDDKLPIE